MKDFQQLPSRLRDKISIDTDGCWRWTGSIHKNGYGQAHRTGRGSMGAHRLVYEMLVGEIPPGLQLDHLCRVRHCVNPEHLGVVTNRENVLRGIGISAVNARKTHCKRGHALSGENLYTYADGSRLCRRCQREAERLRYQPVAPKTHCKRGHPLSGDNLYVYRGRRSCRECGRQYRRIWNRADRRKKKAGKP